MSIINFGKKAELETAKVKGELVSVQKDLKVFKFQVQGFIDAMTGEEAAYLYGNNRYRDYGRAVDAINKKYENNAPWGNGLTANIIDFRAAVTVSSGPQYKPAMQSTIKTRDDEGQSIGGENQMPGAQSKADKMKEGGETGAEKEMDFCRSLWEVNDINHETPQEWGREAEIEGRVAVTLEYDKDKQQVVAQHRPWSIYKYKEIRNKTNRKIIEGITWDANQAEGIEAGKAEGDALICRRFAGRPSAKNPTTKVMRCLTEIEYIDQAFRDWREINRLYASPIPVFECGTPEEAEEMNAQLKAGLNFKIKKAWAVMGRFKFAGPEMSGIDSLEREIKRQACFVAGTTGYPLQFLLPDMLSNRSTSENIMESALIHTASERAIWIGFYEELVKKAMRLSAAGTGKTALDPNKISISISLMTQEQWTRLVQFWLPAFRDDLVTREAVLPMIPDFNVREELDRREEADASQVAQIGKELDKVKREADLNNENNLPSKGNQFGKPQEGK
jgi:hypothetical protein